MTDAFIQVQLDTSSIEEYLNVESIQKAAEEALSESTALILNRIRNNFLSQVSPDGVPWEPSYAAFKRSFTGRGGGTLFDTGNLFHSIQEFSISPLEMAIGTDVPYGIFHQDGTSKLPKREFLGFNEGDAQLALQVFIRKIKEALPS